MQKTQKWILFSSFFLLAIYGLLTQRFSPSPSQHHVIGNETRFPVQLVQNRQPLNVSVPEIAKQVTVRILTNPGAGSGVIIGRRGQVYTVLTCAHVMANRSDNKYTVLTADGRTHAGEWLRSLQFGDLDLALVQFTSNQSYRVVELGDSDNLAMGDRLYAAGFPNWYWINRNAIEETRNWGLRAYRLTTGEVGMMAQRSLPRGYQLGYTNEIEQGMSGGPVLNELGQLVAINGRLKYPIQGMNVYRFADGSFPSEPLFQEMEGLSWAIPISAVREMLR